MKETFAKLSKLSPTDAEIATAISSGTTLKHNFELLLDPNINAEEETLELYIKTYRELYNSPVGISKSSIYFGVKDVIVKLYQHDINLVLTSNKGIVAIINALEYFGLREYFDLIIGDEPHVEKKSNPMIFTSIIAPRFNNLKTDEILIVGNTEIDITFGKEY